MKFSDTDRLSVVSAQAPQVRSAPAPEMTCGEMLVKLLEGYGVEWIFGIPGAHTIELYRGLADARLRHVTPRHEQGAGFMADGYARVTGKPGVCFIITGPGMTNIATAMAQAYADSIPMLVISSVNARHQLGNGNGHLHELPSQRDTVAGFTAFSHTLMSPDELPDVLARAFAVFESARPRPVHIELPLDVITAPAGHLSLARVPMPAKPKAAANAIEQTAERLAQARRPLLLVGGGALAATDEVRALAARLQAPVALTINAKGVLPPDHPLLLGSTQSTRPTRELVREADVVLAVGTELGETDYDVVFDGGFAIDGTLIRIDIDRAQLTRNFPADIAIHADAQQALHALVAALVRKDVALPAADWGAARVVQTRHAVSQTFDAAALAHQRLIETAAATLPDVIMVGDSTQPVYTGNVVYDAAQPRSWFNASTGYGTLGYGLPAAIGARIGAPQRPVVCLIGDGGLQFTLPELGAAVEAGVPVAVVVWNNRGYAEIKKYMVERDITPVGVDIYTPDFVTIARGFGCEARRINNPAALADALREAMTQRVPTLIEIDESQWFEEVRAC